MSLPSLSISRHVLTMALSLVIMLAGLVGYHSLPLERMPKIEVPVLTVLTTLSGASPETVAQVVTAPLETQLNTVSGIDTITSVSGVGVSTVTLTFTSDVDVNDALLDVQSKLEQAKRGLPDEAGSPVVMKFDINAQPVIQLTLNSDAHNLVQLSSMATQVSRRLEGLWGVGSVDLRGTRDEQILVQVNEAALAARGITVSEITAAFARNHIRPVGGRVRAPGRDFMVDMDFEARTPDQIRSMLIATLEGVPVRLSDVAEVRFGESDELQYAYFNRKPGISLSITKTDDANAVEVVDTISEMLPALRAMLPEGVSLEIAQEESQPIKDIVAALKDHLIEGTIFTAIVIWLFLANVRATFIIATAIPVSLLGSVAAFQFLGYTLNSFTLLALLLLIGIVVDDAIVVLENIYRKQEEGGMSPQEAATKGAEGVMFAVAASTLTLVSIFAPIMYLEGVLGQVFLPFAAIVTVGVLISWFVALTLTPMLCAKYLRHSAQPGRIARALNRSFVTLETVYSVALGHALRYRWTVILLALLTTAPAGLLLRDVDKGFLPTQDTGRVSVRVEFPAGDPSSAVSVKLERLEAALRTVPEVTDILMTFREAGRSGTPNASADVTLTADRMRSQTEIINVMNEVLRPLDGMRAFAGASSGPGGGGPSFQFNLIGPSQADIARVAPEVMETLRASPVLAGLQNNLNLSTPQVRIELDREKAATLGVSAHDVGQAVAALTGQITLSSYTAADGERYDIKLQTVLDDETLTPDRLMAAQVRTASGSLVSLSEVARPVVEGTAGAVTRVSQRYAVSFSATPNGSMGEATALVEAVRATLPPGFEITYGGQSAEFKKIGRSLAMVLSASMLLLYLVMASQFNSYRQPAILMLAQPLAAIGGIGALWVTGNSLNIYSMVGLVLLVGLTAKTGILLVDRANQLVEEGQSIDQAIKTASPERLRPILMTALTVLTSLAPAAMGLGPGAENNGPLAVAVIGGMLSSTALTLFVIPAAYSLLSKKPLTHGAA